MGRRSKIVKQLFLFGVVGGISFLIDLLVTTSLYNFFHAPPFLAGTIGFLSAFFFNFPVNRKHVFNHSVHDRFSMKAQVSMYMFLSLFNLIVTGVLMQLIVGSGTLKIGLAKGFVTALIAAWNFLLFRFVIFSKRPNQGELEGLVIQ